MIKIFNGVDIEDISRFKNKTLENDEHFLKRVYTENELRYCFSHKSPEQHLAVRYCAKEAVYKALSEEIKDVVSFKNIEVLNNEKGKPYINILNYAGDIKIALSLSHEKDKAIAFVTAYKED